MTLPAQVRDLLSHTGGQVLFGPSGSLSQWFQPPSEYLFLDLSPRDHCAHLSRRWPGKHSGCSPAAPPPEDTYVPVVSSGWQEGPKARLLPRDQLDRHRQEAHGGAFLMQLLWAQVAVSHC